MRQVDGLADGSGDEGLNRRHHPHVTLPADRALAVGGREGAIEDGEIVLPEVGGTLDGVLLVDVGHDVGDRLRAIAELAERRGHGPIDHLEKPPAHQFLVLDQGDVRLHPGGVTVEHEGDGAGWGQDRGLGVAVAVDGAQLMGVIPSLAGGRQDRGRRVLAGDLVGGGAVLFHHPQHGLAVDLVALKGADLLGDPGRLRVRLTGEDGG